MISLGVPDLRIPYFADLATIILRRASETGGAVLIEQTGGEPEAEARLLQDSHRRVDGVILSPLGLSATEVAGLANGLPVVLLGEASGERVLDHVSVDNVAAARTATDHLIRTGRKRIALIGAQRKLSSHTARQRELGYRTALTSAGREVDERLLVEVQDFHRTDGGDALKHLIELPERPDAALCLNDLLAIGALRAAHERGIRVPDDFALIGMDDIEETRFSVPTLSTIQPDKAAIASWAVDRLIARMGGDQSGPYEQLMPYRLLVRESTGLPPHAD